MDNLFSQIFFITTEKIVGITILWTNVTCSLPFKLKASFSDSLKSLVCNNWFPLWFSMGKCEIILMR